jgi:hypothetical protein
LTHVLVRYTGDMVKRASARGRKTTADLVLTRTLSTPDGQFAESLEALLDSRRKLFGILEGRMRDHSVRISRLL